MKKPNKKAPLSSQCSQKLEFDAIAGKPLVVDFDGGDISSDSGLLLLAEANDKLGLSRAMAPHLEEWRDPARVTHELQTMLDQRIFGICAGYADCDDHDAMRSDPAMKIACDKAPQSEGDLASQPTFSRFENQVSARSLVKLGLAQGRCIIESLPENTREVILDVDATCDPAHGDQQFTFFNKYLQEKCYYPLLMHLTCEDGKQHPLGALLRPGNAGACVGLEFMVKHAVRELRRLFPQLKITLRADSAYGCDQVLRLCHRLKIDFALGMAGNARLKKLSQLARQSAVLCHRLASCGVFEDSRAFDEVWYQAHSWEQRERVIIRSQIQDGSADTRYVVTSLRDGNAPAIHNFYCGRGEQENRIKELKLDLDSGRTSCGSFLANQFRLLLHLAANMVWDVVQQGLRVVAAGSDWATYQIGSLRERLVKVGARVIESRRRVIAHLASSYPYAALWRRLHAHLRATPG